MRCLHFQKHVKKNKTVLTIKVVCFSFLTLMLSTITYAAIESSSTQATHFIQQYLQQHASLIESVEQTQDDTLNEVNQLAVMKTSQIAASIHAAQPLAVPAPSIFPVVSKQLTPGRVASKSVQLHLSQPVFLVGDDEQSKIWLNNYRQRLEQLHAKGYVVNVDSQTAMNALIHAFKQLPLIAMPADSIAQRIGVHHYPVLLSNHLVDQ